MPASTFRRLAEQHQDQEPVLRYHLSIYAHALKMLAVTG